MIRHYLDSARLYLFTDARAGTRSELIDKILEQMPETDRIQAA